jgi:hypothetical protein
MSGWMAGGPLLLICGRIWGRTVPVGLISGGIILEDADPGAEEGAAASSEPIGGRVILAPRSAGWRILKDG